MTLRVSPPLDRDLLDVVSFCGGESRISSYTGTKALMLAVLEDGIRCYLNGVNAVQSEAEYWIAHPEHLQPFAFTVICETLGLDPDAVRRKLWSMRARKLSAREAIGRPRSNVHRGQAVGSPAQGARAFWRARAAARRTRSPS